MADPNDLADELEREASAQDHYCSEVGNWAGGYDCNCGRSAWYTHLSTPPHQGCLFEWRLRAAARLLREQAEQLDALRNELSDALGMIVLLLDQMGGKATITDRELVDLDRTREIRTYTTDADPYTTFVEVRPALAAAGGGVPEEGATDE